MKRNRDEQEATLSQSSAWLRRRGCQICGGISEFLAFWCGTVGSE